MSCIMRSYTSIQMCIKLHVQALAYHTAPRRRTISIEEMRTSELPHGTAASEHNWADAADRHRTIIPQRDAVM